MSVPKLDIPVPTLARGVAVVLRFAAAQTAYFADNVILGMSLMQHGQSEYKMGPTGMMVQDAVAGYPSEGSLDSHMPSYGQVMIPGYAPTQHGFIPMVYCASPYGQWPQAASYADYGVVSMMPEAQSIGPYYTIDAHGNYVLIQPAGTESGKLMTSNGDSKGTDGNKENLPPKGGPGGDGESRPDTLPSDPSPSFFGASAGRPFIPGLQAPIFGIRRPFPPNQPGRRNNATYKTMMCTMFAQSGECNYGVRCQYAHGQEELRVVAPHPKFKTQMCNKYNSATGCQYGDKCHFRHPNDPIPEFTSSMTSGRQFDQRFRKFERIGKGGYEKRIPADKSNSNQTNTSVKTAVAAPCKEKSDEKIGDHFKKTKEHFRTAFSGNNILDQLNEKNKECFISLSMYHHFEVYVGKNKKVSTLKRSNSLNTVGSFTFQRFVAMREIIKTEVNRLKPKGGNGKNENTRLKSHNNGKMEEKSPISIEGKQKGSRKNSKPSPRSGNKKKHH